MKNYIEMLHFIIRMAVASYRFDNGMFSGLMA